MNSAAQCPTAARSPTRGPPGQLADQLRIDRIHQLATWSWQGCPGGHTTVVSADPILALTGATSLDGSGEPWGSGASYVLVTLCVCMRRV